MKRFLTAALVGTVLTTTAAIAMQSEPPAAAKPPMTKAKMLARADARFDALDTNKDGQLSPEELQAGMARARAAMQQRAQAAGGEMSDFMGGGAGRRGGGAGGKGDRGFSRMDTNGDGMISRAEYRAAAEARFARMDANDNGVIDPDERGGRRGMGGGQGAGGPGAGGPGAGGPGGERRGMRGAGKGGPHGVMKADTNGDGVVTRAEYDAYAAARFKRLDTNGDGRIDAADRPQRPMQRPATPPPPPASTPDAG